MRCTYTEYKDLCSAGYEKTIVELSKDLCKKAFAFYESAILGVPVSTLTYAPNLSLIEEAVLNTIVDIHRVKMYHPVNNPTRYKYAAYLGFWWERAKPFLCKEDNYNKLREIARTINIPDMPSNRAYSAVLDISKCVNEIFICDYMLEMIQILSGQATECSIDQNKVISYNNIKDSLEYFLRYRNYTAQSLELFLKGINVCPMDIGVINNQQTKEAKT